MQFMNTLDSKDALNIITYDNKKNLNDNMCSKKKSLNIVYATTQEKLEHEKYLDFIEMNNKKCLWRQYK